MSFNFDFIHPHTVTLQTKTEAFTCSKCNKEKQPGHSYFCADCNFTVCVDCVNEGFNNNPNKPKYPVMDMKYLYDENNPNLYPSKGLDEHKLDKTVTHVAFNCPKCNRKVNEEWIYKCFICEYNICQQCYESIPN